MAVQIDVQPFRTKVCSRNLPPDLAKIGKSSPKTKSSLQLTVDSKEIAIVRLCIRSTTWSKVARVQRWHWQLQSPTTAQTSTSTSSNVLLPNQCRTSSKKSLKSKQRHSSSNLRQCLSQITTRQLSKTRAFDRALTNSRVACSEHPPYLYLNQTG